MSIPAWYDWEGTGSTCQSYFSLVSIPAWYDWESELSFDAKNIFTVSIPAWYDWETASASVLGGVKVFQFQLGTIGRFFIFNDTI